MSSGPECEQLVGELRRLRAWSGLSLTALAARTPYSKSSWQRYLCGEQPVPRRAVEALCAVAGEPSRRLLALWELADAVWSGRAVRAPGLPVDGQGAGRGEGAGRVGQDGRGAGGGRGGQSPVVPSHEEGVASRATPSGMTRPAVARSGTAGSWVARMHRRGGAVGVLALSAAAMVAALLAAWVLVRRLRRIRSRSAWVPSCCDGPVLSPVGGRAPSWATASCTRQSGGKRD
ncbi:helix-turn-helix domain-containing protein [Streptomyces sp. NPDC127084]|uniref:helix-turn-helix domain-containing protein n=1 Tax=Streptomyces sp. NPDC127084 TaxID=3347133 RepID=UPI00365AE19C